MGYLVPIELEHCLPFGLTTVSFNEKGTPMTKTLEEMLEELTEQGITITFEGDAGDGIKPIKVVKDYKHWFQRFQYTSIAEVIEEAHQLYYTPPPPTAEELLKEIYNELPGSGQMFSPAKLVEIKQKLERYLEQEGKK